MDTASPPAGGATARARSMRVQGRPGPEGPNESRSAAANDADDRSDDGALADAALAAVLVHGLKQTRVVLAGHDPSWARRFAARAAELRRVLGERARLVEHVGSTAVPGLAAKPVVDILVGVDDPDEEAAYLPDLEAAGYDLKVREPQHRCLRAGDPGEPVNLHCYPPGHPEIRKLLLFRDHLRRNARDRRRYEAAKRELATRQWRDMNHYAAAKGPVIAEILCNAGWTASPE